MNPSFRLLAGVIGVGSIILIVAVFALTAGDGQPPTHLQVQSEASDAGAASSVSLSVDIDAGLRLKPSFPLFSSFALIAPPEWKFADGAAIGIGATVGRLSGTLNVAVGSADCDQEVTFEVDLYNSVVSGRWLGRRPLDANGNGFPDSVDDVPKDTLADVPGTPKMRLFGVSADSTAPPILVNVLVSRLDEQSHRLDIFIADDYTRDIRPEPSAVCSPLNTELTLFGRVADDPGNRYSDPAVVVVNPPNPGYYPWQLSIRGPDYSADSEGTVQVSAAASGSSVEPATVPSP